MFILVDGWVTLLFGAEFGGKGVEANEDTVTMIVHMH